MSEVVSASDGGLLTASCWGHGVQLQVNSKWANPTGKAMLRIASPDKQIAVCLPI
jgi:hypothetical protein